MYTYLCTDFSKILGKKYNVIYLCTSDCTKWRKLFPETFIINTIIKIFHIKVNALKKKKGHNKTTINRGGKNHGGT